jgi:hypothetical protein
MGGNPPMGTDFVEGDMGVVQLEFDGVDLGLTVDETTLEKIEDIKDIKFAQLGTQPADKVPTGQAYQVKTKLGETSLVKLRRLMRGLVLHGHNARLGADLYRSGYTYFCKQLVIRRVDSQGTVSTDPHFRVTFYKAFPEVNATPGGPFGPDVQRVTEVTFYIFLHRGKHAFGFIGQASSCGL